MNTLHKQNGSTLLFTLIVLVALLFGSVALFRSTDAAGTIASNLSFKEVAVKAADVAVQDASTYINAITNFETDGVVGGATKYYHFQRKTTAQGIVCPTQQVDKNADASATGGYCTTPPTDAEWGTALTVGQSKVWYIVDRLCESTPTNDVTLKCLTTTDTTRESSSVVGYQFKTISIFYRVTVRIKGASNTEAYVQVIIPRQLS